MSIHLQIPTPCHENWDTMQPDKDGRHCMSCCKTVVDFSNMTDQEILNYISNASGEICGRTDQSQLNRGLRENKFRKKFSWAYIWNMIILLFVFAGKTKAQGSVVIWNKNVVKKEPGKKQVPLVTKKTISGIVMNAMTGEPVPFASVMLKGTSIGTSSDSSGKFLLDYPLLIDSVELEISSSGFEKATFIINDEQQYNLLPIANELNTVVVKGNNRTMGKMVRCVTTTRYRKVIRAVNDWLPKKDIVVYPNPIIAGNQIQVALQLKEKGQYRLDLIDASGRVVWMQTANLANPNYKLSIPTQSVWASGVYWLRISGKHTRKVYNGKVIIQ